MFDMKRTYSTERVEAAINIRVHIKAITPGY